jgi:hypothetical protein
MAAAQLGLTLAQRQQQHLLLPLLLLVMPACCALLQQSLLLPAFLPSVLVLGKLQSVCAVLQLM